VFYHAGNKVRDMIQMDLVMHIRPPLMDGLIKVMLNWIESILIYQLINLMLSLRSVREVRLKN